MIAEEALAMAKSYTQKSLEGQGALKCDKGDKGDKGTTPHIDETTKNWFIGDVDTGILAQGANGKDGKSISTITKDDDNNLIVTFTDGSTSDGYNETGSGYISIGGATPSGTSRGYISEMLITDNGLIPTIASGSATTYYCDGLLFNNSQVNYVLVGGASHNASPVGAFYSNLNDVASATDVAIAAALSCKPLA